MDEAFGVDDTGGGAYMINCDEVWYIDKITAGAPKHAMEGIYCRRG